MGKFIDITGNKCGKLTVLERAENNKHGHVMWKCICDCGNAIVTVGQGLKYGNATSCGCGRIKDIAGVKFGLLTAVEVVGNRNGAVWKCVCVCGNERDVKTSQLRNGSAYSCGCTTRDGRVLHGMSRHYLYGTYVSMCKRCECETDIAYPDYGGRGIRVCDRWRNGDGTRSGFECFLADMGDRPDGMTIDRKNANKGYEPTNCRWATYAVQSNNRRSPVRNRHMRLLLSAIDACLEECSEENLSALMDARAKFVKLSQTYQPANDNVPTKVAA